ncbi:hypothetical protein FHR92_002489 [Fontibacillus solani]|uniref:Copper amine oxidase-like N-terminal domain-containing protein n=1 Tax=Fontibacillus solani TaxID=1572857 RepID=A0A7W3STS1_9BACL|nr:copper amine oxidase N-terminal domain-containing protein [Fontibacillus solani]MBA9086017.1 hypothetical protein [Fontibacillus solani]
MKKIIYLTLMGCLATFVGLFFSAPITSAAAPVSYTLYIEGKVSSAKFPTVVEKNTTLIPMKSVLSELNYTTTLDNQTKTITAKNSAGSFITVKTGSKKATINGAEVLLSASVKTMNGTTYIPLSAVQKLTGKSIGSDASQGIAWIGEKPTTAFIPPWGVTLDQIKLVSGRKLLIDEGEQGDIYILMYQVPGAADELNVFYKNKLAKMAFITDFSGSGEATELLGIYGGIYDSLTKTYGKPVEGYMSLNDNPLDQYLTLFADQGYLSSKWQAGSTTVSLLLKATDTGYTISMQYVNASVEAELNAALDALK